MDFNTRMNEKALNDEALEHVSGGKKDQVPYIEMGTHVWFNDTSRTTCYLTNRCKATYYEVSGWHNQVTGVVKVRCPLCGRDTIAEDTSLIMV